MMSLKPIFLFRYLKFKKNTVPENIKRLFYLSYEDALWDILDKKQVGKNSVILVPELFCGDVENNIINHGYKIAYYPVSNKLKTTDEQLVRSIKKYKPAVLIIFHAVGITNNLFRKTSWLKNIDENVILIEDCVHKIVDQHKTKFLKKNHFIIDSLRKVVPLQGSVVYGQKDDLNFAEPSFFQSSVYATKITVLWMTMNIFWVLTQIFSGTRLSVWFADKANRSMKIGYDLIGDNFLPARGSFVFSFLQQFIDFEKIKKTKKRQVEFYEKKLSNLSSKIFQKVPYSKSDKSELIAYPLILPIDNASKILRLIHHQGLMFNFELNDSVWSRKQKMIYLPLGPHITERNFELVVSTILKFNHFLL
ncbi:hypothetical protein HZA76_01080 [Candidatus Roizmanbacteria bacterium]|nr:hypothetical protein [Candidatus Roizmanbacteria bacterium]